MQIHLLCVAAPVSRRTCRLRAAGSDPPPRRTQAPRNAATTPAPAQRCSPEPASLRPRTATPPCEAAASAVPTAELLHSWSGAGALGAGAQARIRPAVTAATNCRRPRPAAAPAAATSSAARRAPARRARCMLDQHGARTQKKQQNEKNLTLPTLKKQNRPNRRLELSFGNDARLEKVDVKMAPASGGRP